MKNTFTRGSEGIDYNLITNEDKTLVCEVISYNQESKIVSAKKVWDEGNTILYAWNRNNIFIIPGQLILLYRVGDFNNNPRFEPSQYELHEASPSKVSWFCLSYAPIIFVRDVGGNKGKEVIYNGTAFIDVVGSPILPLTTTEKSTAYHDGIPPYKENRIYWAQRINGAYLCFLPGYGNIDETLEVNIEYDLFLDLDNSGKLINFRASERGWRYSQQIINLGGSMVESSNIGIICYAEKKATLVYVAAAGTYSLTLREYNNGWGNAQTFDTTTNKPTYHLAKTSNNRALLAWEYDNGAGRTVKAKIRDENGTWGNIFSFSDSKVLGKLYCDINDSGNAVIAYRKDFLNPNTAVDNTKLCVRHYSIADSSWSAEINLDATTLSSGLDLGNDPPGCAINNDGEIVVTGYYNISAGSLATTWNYKAFLYDGSIWDSGTDLSKITFVAVQKANTPTYADINNNGKAIVAFTELTTGAAATDTARAAYYNGSTWETTTDLDITTNELFYGVSINNSNKAQLIWITDNEVDTTEAIWQIIIDDGSYGTKVKIAEATASTPFSGGGWASNISDDGTGLIIWSNLDSGVTTWKSRFIKNYAGDVEKDIFADDNYPFPPAIPPFRFPEDSPTEFDIYNNFAIAIWEDTVGTIEAFKHSGTI